VYPFRDDALRVWRAIESFVRAYVWRWYASDEAVADEAFLHAWGATPSLAPTEGGVAGFVAPQDREALSRALTLVVYTASAQHAAVNFPQFPLMSFAPLMSGAGWSDAPGAVDERGGIAAFLPPRPVARQQAELLHLLSSVCHAPLGGFDEGWFDDREVGEMVERFQHELRSLDDEIDRENDARRWPYPYLRPSRVPRSVNI